MSFFLQGTSDCVYPPPLIVERYWTFPSYSEYEYEPDSDKFDLKSGGVLSLKYIDANVMPTSRKT